MPINLETVEPGDLILAEDWNELVTCVMELDQRLAILEAQVNTDGSVEILSITPVGTLEVNQVVNVFGRNFQFSIGGHRVFIGGVAVNTFLPGSNDTRLVFNIPAIPGLPDQGETQTLQITNTFSSAEVPVFIQPESQDVEGGVDVFFLGVNPTTPEANAPITFQYRIASRANITADFAITPNLIVPDNQALWEERLQILDENLNVITTGLIESLQPAAERIFHVRITSIPDVAAGTQFSLSVSAGAGTVSGTSGLETLSVGEATEPQDDTISVGAISAQFLGTGSFSDSTLVLGTGSSALVTMQVTFTVVGTYDVGATLGENTAGWTAERFSDTTPEAFVIEEADLRDSGSATRLVEYVVAAPAGASAEGSAAFVLQRSEAAVARTTTIALVLSQ